MNLVFVYGSLKKGQGNHGVLYPSELHVPTPKPTKFVGNDKILGRIYDLGYYPGLKPDFDAKVHGEIYEVDAPVLERLDRLEGHPDLYTRKEVLTENGVKCWTYFYNGNVDNRHYIRSGVW